MKLVSASTAAAALALAALAISAPSTAAAADVSIMGAKDATPMMRGTDIGIATHDILNKPTGLVNKNSVLMDNNMAIARSNIVLTQNDRIALAKKVEELVAAPATEADDARMTDDMSTAVLSKNVLNAVSGKDTDAATMTKVSAVVAAKDSDASTRQQRIADLVNTVFDAKRQEADEREQSIQSESPRGVIVLVGAKDILRQPTAIVNKNVAVTDTQVAVSRSTVAPSQNDNVMLTGDAKVADAVLPASSIRVDTDMAAADKVRTGFLFAKDAMKDAKASTEQFGVWGGIGGLGFGWRYPLGYWNMYGAGLYGGGCGLGLGYGSYFYC